MATCTGYNASMFRVARPLARGLRSRTFPVVILVFSLPGFAQEHAAQTAQSGSRVFAQLPLSSQPATVLAMADAPSPPAPRHRFWDRENRLLFGGIALFRALDYVSTRNMQARGREEILLPDEIVNNSTGFASLETAGTIASVGLSYWMHRASHHRLERWVSITHIGVTAFGAARNYSLKSKHPVPPAIR